MSDTGFMKCISRRVHPGAAGRLTGVLFVAGLSVAAAEARPIGRRGPVSGESAPSLAGAFAPINAKVRRSVVRIRIDHTVVARATVIDDRGGLATKASELTSVEARNVETAGDEGEASGGREGRASMEAVLANDRAVPIKLIGTDRASDLALLRLDDASRSLNLKPVDWAQSDGKKHTERQDAEGSHTPRPPLGTWVMSAGQNRRPLGVGIVSAASRTIAPGRVLLGVEIAPDRPGPRVQQTLEGMGAAEAGLQAGDQITHVAGQRTATRQAVVNQLDGRMAGEDVGIKVKRGDKTIEFEVTLAPLPVEKAGRSARMNRMGGNVSERARGFARVIQHDTVLEPNQVGSPLVNLEGEVIGLNIARARRTASYALPAALVKKVIARLTKADAGER